MLIGNVYSRMSQYQGSELLVRELGILARSPCGRVGRVWVLEMGSTGV